MTAAVDSLEILQHVIRDHYDLGRVDMPTVMPAAHQRRHRKLVVNTAIGQFLAKTYKRDPFVLDALRFQHRLSDHLATNGIPVAKIQRTSKGTRIVEMNTWALELQEFVGGKPMLVSKETLAVSAETLGKFHRVCRDFPRPERDTTMWRFSEVPRQAFTALYSQAKEMGDVDAVNYEDYH